MDELQRQARPGASSLSSPHAAAPPVARRPSPVARRPSPRRLSPLTSPVASRLALVVRSASALRPPSRSRSPRARLVPSARVPMSPPNNTPPSPSPSRVAPRGGEHRPVLMLLLRHWLRGARGTGRSEPEAAGPSPRRAPRSVSLRRSSSGEGAGERVRGGARLNGSMPNAGG